MRGWIRLGAAAAVAALIALAMNGSAPAQQIPGVFTVTTTADGNDHECTKDCTLREAVSLAAPGGGSSINLPSGVYRLTQGPLILANNAVIFGTGSVGGFGAGARTTVIDARGASRVLQVPAGSSSIVAGVTIRGGSAATGGGALIAANATLQLYNTIVEDNTATTRGGAVQALGEIAVQSSLITGNRAANGGGVAVEADGEGIFIASTLSGNRATGSGGGIDTAGSISMTTTTIAGNTAQSGGGFFQESSTGASTSIWNTIINGAGSGGACGGSIAGVPRSTFSHNLSDDATCLYATTAEGTGNADSRLGALRNNGGPTDTRALGAGSPAINGGDPNLCIGNDQRNAAPVGVCDIGAFEFGGQPPVAVLPPPVPGKTANVNRASGIVKIKLPGSNEFFELRDAQQVPIGSTFDTVKGRVNLVTAANKVGKTQRAWFYQGLFKLGQTKGSTPLTTLKMTGKLSCGHSSLANAAKKKKKKRHLWGDGKGKFRTQGSFSSATVRGTRWLVQDTCKGTLTVVKRGTVTVRDFVKRKNVTVRAGHRYFARKK